MAEKFGTSVFVRLAGIFFDFDDNVMRTRGGRAYRRSTASAFDWDADSVSRINDGATAAGAEVWVPNPWVLGNSAVNHVNQTAIKLQ